MYVWHADSVGPDNGLGNASGISQGSLVSSKLNANVVPSILYDNKVCADTALHAECLEKGSISKGHTLEGVDMGSQSMDNPGHEALSPMLLASKV